MKGNVLIRNKLAIVYGISLGILLLLLKWLELKFIIFNHGLEIYIAAIAIIFTMLGIWLAMKLMKPKKETVYVENVVYNKSNSAFSVNETALSKTGLSKRELEVLQLMSAGFSNKEIAGQLFVSLHTIKTHGSRLFEKLDVKRRTQAIEKARRLQLIP